VSEFEKDIVDDPIEPIDPMYFPLVIPPTRSKPL